MHPDIEEYLKLQRAAHPNEIWLLDDGEENLGYRRAESMTKAFNRHFQAPGITGQGIKATHCNRALMARRMR